MSNWLVNPIGIEDREFFSFFAQKFLQLLQASDPHTESYSENYI